MPSIALTLLACNKLAVRAAGEREALQAACDLLVAEGGFLAASCGGARAGDEAGAADTRSFSVYADDHELGPLTVVSDFALFPALVQLLAEWCESFACLVTSTHRRRRIEAFLAKTQRLAKTGSFGWSSVTGDISWSEETFRLYEYDRSRIKPTLEDALARIHPEDHERVREVIARATRDDRDFEFEHRLLFPDGRVKHLQLVVQAVGAGEFVGAVLDVTASKEMQQALAFRDQVMGILGHDLHNPLSAIQGIVGLFQLNEELSPKAREQLVQLKHAAARMREMIEALLDFTRTRFAGKLPVSPAPTDLREICGRVVEELAAGHPCREIHFEAEGDACGRWDPGRIAQVVSNLLANALTHGDPQASVHLSIAGDTDDVALKVHNRGPAVERELIPVLFEPFRRGAGGAQSRSPGLGLGLHIVKQIVTAHGGSISVQSSADAGTTFCVALPRRTHLAERRDAEDSSLTSDEERHDGKDHDTLHRWSVC